MKKIFIASLILAQLYAPCVFAENSGRRFSSSRNNLKSIKAVRSSQIFKPSVLTDYLYVDNDWQLIGKSFMEYDVLGNVITERTDNMGETLVTRNEYDNFNNQTLILVTIEGDEGTENYMKRTYAYDPIVTDYCIERMGYEWTGSAWKKDYYCESNTITRNPEGNITEIVKSLPLGEEMVPAYKHSWNYNTETGKADQFVYYANYSSGDVEWSAYDNLSYRDILWNRTDGQLIKRIDEMLSGANRVSQYAIYYNNEIDGYGFVEYSDEFPLDYIFRSTYSNPEIVGETIERKTIDKYGGYQIIRSEYFDEQGTPTERPTYILTETIKFDNYGNLVSDELHEQYGEGEPELVAGATIRYSYSKEGNVLEELEFDYDYDSKSYLPEFKTIYEDYKDVSEVESLPETTEGLTIDSDLISASDPALTGLSIYDMRGMLLRRVASTGNAQISCSGLPAGVYVLRIEGTGKSVKFRQRCF